MRLTKKITLKVTVYVEDGDEDGICGSVQATLDMLDVEHVESEFVSIQDHYVDEE